MANTTQRAELTEIIAMSREGIAWCEANDEPVSPKQREALERYLAQLARLGSSEGNVIRVADGEGTGTALRLTDRPAGGKAHSNQYGACTVTFASQKQTNFIKALMDRKDLSPLEDSVVIDVARLRMQVAKTEINKKAASAIIDRLLALPERSATPIAAQSTNVKASEKQLDFIARLAAERELDAVERDALAASLPQLSTKGASKTIENLLARPMATVAPLVIEAGVYVNTDGSVFRVYFGQQSGQMLAARVEGNEFVYAGKADRFITFPASRKMTIEEAAAWGKATGTCIVCARRLDVPESVDRGIGPVCFAKMGG